MSTGAFADGEDFISFDVSPPPQSPGAGPSRAKSPPLGPSSKSKRQREDANADDEELLARRSGHSRNGEATEPAGQSSGKKRKHKDESAPTGEKLSKKQRLKQKYDRLKEKRKKREEERAEGREDSFEARKEEKAKKREEKKARKREKKAKKKEEEEKGKVKKTEVKGNGKAPPKGPKSGEGASGSVSGNGSAKRDVGSMATNRKDERKAAERAAPWADDVDWADYRDPAEMLNAEIHAFYNYMSPTRAEYSVRECLIKLIERVVIQIWPEAEVVPFGSWQTQLYLPTGDIDLVIITDRLTESNKQKMLHKLASAMRSNYITQHVAVIAKAKVPIIKFVTIEGRLNVDISLGQTNGVAAGKIINQYLDALRGSRQLILVVKAFLSQRSMNEVYTGGLGSYSVICMVLNFLQIHPKIRRAEIDPEKNLGTLLIEFFELYGRNFNYDEVGISIRRGGGYYSKRARGWANYNNQPFLLSIEDPQDPDNDISRSSHGIRQVKLVLAGAYDLLQAQMFDRAAELSSRLSGKRKGDALDPETMSILTGVMGVTKETTKHRIDLKTLYDSGRLQRKLGVSVEIDSEAHLPNNWSARGPASSPGPARGDGMQAIIVDDDEVGEDDDSDEDEDEEDDSDEDEDEDEDEAEEDEEEEAGVDDEDDDYSPEEEEEEEEEEVNRLSRKGSGKERVTAGSSNTARKDRFASVSSDGIEFVPEQESRYALGRGGGAKGSKSQTADNEDSDGDSSSSSIILLDSAPDMGSSSKSRSGSATSGKSKSDRKAGGQAQARRAFWASKGGRGQADQNDDLDDDYIGL